MFGELLDVYDNYVLIENKTEVIDSNYLNIHVVFSDNNRKIVGKSQSIWRFNNTLLNSTWVEKEISRGILKHFGLNENETTIYQNLWSKNKVHFGENFKTLNDYVGGKRGFN